jgi:hypothetical protein
LQHAQQQQEEKELTKSQHSLPFSAPDVKRNLILPPRKGWY